MRPEFDSEIDSLLRGRARHGAASPAVWGGGLHPPLSDDVSSVSHLDADEIAAFGEGALPAAARARYSAHLADCDDCRRSVTQITLAAGVADRIEEGERKSGPALASTRSPSWHERLAAIFAPRAWRYAMPVVALLAVSAVVLVVTRRLPQDAAMETARQRGNTVQQPTAPAAPESHHADAPPQPAAQTGTQAGAEVAAVAPPAAGEDRESGGATDSRARPAEDVGQSAAGGSAATAGAQPEVTQRSVSQVPPASAPTSANAPAATQMPAPPPAAAAPAPRPTVSRDVATQPTPAPTSENVEVARESTRDDSRHSAPRDEAPATKRHGPQRSGITRGERTTADLASETEASKNERASRRARQAATGAANRGEDDEAKAGREEDREQQRRAETRSVGRRRFRREGNVWIDAAYKASQATVTVRRDSEQYRALVADEPEIGRISRALGGEAVIVWKNRAYRIKP